MKKYQTEEERKQAKREYAKQRYQTNKEKIAEQQKQYYQDNREKRLEQRKQYRQNNKEKLAEYDKQYRQDNAERIAEYNKQYYQDNRERLLEHNKQYCKTLMGRAAYLVSSYNQADKQMGRGKCTLTAKWIVEQIFSQKCIYCGESDWHKLGCDRKDNSLPHTPSNVVCCCGDCNIKRGLKPFENFLAECE